MKLRVKEIVKNRGITMQEIADQLNITRDTLTRNINGNPTLDTLNKIAEVLNVEVWELFTDKSPKKELIALIHYNKEFYQADTINELKDIVDKIEVISEDYGN